MFCARCAGGNTFSLKQKEKELLVTLGLGIGALYLLRFAGRNVARTAAELPGVIAGGAIEGVGEVFGIPVTDQSKCDADLAAGHLWDASFSCPAGRFIKEGVF